MFRSFRAQLTLLFGSLALTMAALLSWQSGERLTEQAERERGDALRHLADGTALMLSEGLAERIREVELLARSSESVPLGLDQHGWRREIERLRSGRPHYTWIGVTDATGTVVLASDGVLVGTDVSQRPWFQGALRGPHVGDVHEARLLARLLPAAADGEPLRFIDFAAPLRDAERRLVGTIGVHADWRWASEIVSRLRSTDVRDVGVQVLIVDREGRAIHDPRAPPADAVAARLPAVEAEPRLQRWADGLHLTATAAVPSTTVLTDLGWKVVARQPAAEALVGARAAQRAAWSVGLLVALGAMLIVWIAADRLSRPLEHIAIAADHILDGDRQVAIPLTRGTAELERLSTSLRLMTRDLVERGEALQQANRQLERRVHERTAELARANEELGRANAELDGLAHQDGLTGLANRRAADHTLAQALAQHRRGGWPLGVLMADIDHFKRVNDSHGHEVGDRVLRAVGACLRESLRESDLAARFGGEEFLIVLPQTDAAGVEAVAHKLRDAIAEMALPQVGRVTLSFGGAVAVGGGERAQLLLRRADTALYAAKQAGRDRLAMAPAAPADVGEAPPALEEAGAVPSRAAAAQ